MLGGNHQHGFFPVLPGPLHHLSNQLDVHARLGRLGIERQLIGGAPGNIADHIGNRHLHFTLVGGGERDVDRGGVPLQGAGQGDFPVQPGDILIDVADGQGISPVQGQQFVDALAHFLRALGQVAPFPGGVTRFSVPFSPLVAPQQVQFIVPGGDAVRNYRPPVLLDPDPPAQVPGPFFRRFRAQHRPHLDGLHERAPGAGHGHPQGRGVSRDGQAGNGQDMVARV